MNAQTSQSSESRVVRRSLAVWQRELRREEGEASSVECITKVQRRYDSLYANCRRPSHPALQRHLGNHILPVLALYQVLREQGRDEQMALKAVEHLFYATWQSRRMQLQRMGRFPFCFEIIRFGTRLQMNRDYPSDGWDTEWVEFNSRTVAFNIHRCYYLEVLTAQRAPEVTPVFCGLDDFLYENMSPYLSWERTRTLGRGDDVCDFRFSRVTLQKGGAHEPQFARNISSPRIQMQTTSHGFFKEGNR